MRLLSAAVTVLFLSSSVPVLAQVASPASTPTPAPAQAAPALPRPALDFATLPFLSDPRLSPSGTQVAAQMAIAGQLVFSIVSLLKDGPRPVVLALGENDLVDCVWVNDNWLAVRVGTVIDIEGEKFYVTRIIGVSADGKTIKPIAFKEGGQTADIIWVASDGTPRILISRQLSVYEGAEFWPQVESVDVSTGRMSKVLSGSSGVMSWYADAAGAVRAGIGHTDSGRGARLIYRADGKGLFHTVDRANSRKDESLTVPLTFPSGNAPTLAFSDHEGRRALYELDMQTFQFGKRVFDIEGYDIDGVIPSPDGTTLAGAAWTANSRQVHWFDPALAAVQDQLDKAVGPKFAASIVSLSRDQKRMLVHVGNASQPGSYYFFDTEGGTMNRFAYVNGAIKGASLAPVSTFRYKARDGLEIAAVLTLPKGRDAKNLPLILLPHGGPAARDYERWDWWVQFLADRGYAVVQPNYRGSTGYGSSLERASQGEWGLKMQDDLNDAVDALATKGMIDPKRVCIVGASYGGYAAMRGAQRDGTRYRCAISFAGVADIPAILRYDGGFLNGGAATDYWKSTAVDLRDVSPVNHPETFSTPILIMHGKKDLRVPVSQSRRMVAKLREAGKAVTYIEQPEGDHHFTRQADRLQFLEEMEKFLKQHNPA